MMTLNLLPSKNNIKNYILVLLPVLSYSYTMFWGSSARVSWWLIDHTRRIDYAVMHYSIAITSLILTYCLLFPRGIHKKVKKYLFIMSIVDLLHLVILSKMYFGMSKVGLVVVIYLVSEIKIKPLNKKPWTELRSYLDF